jgi:tRNA A-37 threonylcarbamoyl transferase component Bud32
MLADYPVQYDSIEQRMSSIVGRARQDNGVVFVKQLITSDTGNTIELARRRIACEANLIRRLEKMSGWKRRLGLVRLVDCDFEHAIIVTEEVAGRPLEQYLVGEFRTHAIQRSRFALYLAGRWLRVFQQLPMSADETSHGRDVHIDTLIEYCDIRLAKIQELGCRWLDNARRSRLLELVGALAGRAPECDRQKLWCHCDFAPGNILWDGAVLTPIDFSMARPDVPLLDVSYMIHRIEMLPVYFPWKRWPVAEWKRAFTRGYGRADVDAAPMYQACMVRHWICRLLTYVRRPGANWKQRSHGLWIRRCIQKALQNEMNLGMG